MVGLHRKRGSRLDFTNDLPWIVVTRMREWKSLGTSGNIMVSFLFIHVGAEPRLHRRDGFARASQTAHGKGGRPSSIALKSRGNPQASHDYLRERRQNFKHGIEVSEVRERPLTTHGKEGRTSGTALKCPKSASVH